MNMPEITSVDKEHLLDLIQRVGGEQQSRTAGNAPEAVPAQDDEGGAFLPTLGRYVNIWA